MDSSLFIDLPKSHYRPGETIRGSILWALNTPPQVLRLNLGWWTEGKGSKDAKIEAQQEWTTAELAGQEPFEFTLPASPYSFSGHLISLHWALDLSLEKIDSSHTLKITVAPGSDPIELPLVDEGRKKSFSLFSHR